jgi:hypothetical protein
MGDRKSDVMQPDSTIRPTDHKSGILWRRWSGTIAFLTLLVVGGLGFAKVENVANNAAVEGHTREVQFCKLVLHGYHDKQKTIVQTRNYLASPQGMEATGINEFIRHASLPKSEQEVKEERKTLPDVCWKYDDQAKKETHP